MPDWMNPPGTFWPVPQTRRRTVSESQEMLTIWQAAVEADTAALIRAIRVQDWPEAHKQAVNLKWDSAKLAGIALDLVRQS